jgi:hypothetical protein
VRLEDFRILDVDRAARPDEREERIESHQTNHHEKELMQK